MQYLITIVSLLGFAWVNYRLGFNKGVEEGIRKGAYGVLDAWQAGIDNENENG